MRPSSKRDWIVLIAILLVGAMLGRSQTSAKQKGGADVISNVVHQVVNPPSVWITTGINRLSDFGTGIWQGRSLVERNRNLADLARSAALYSETVERLQREISSLRKAIGLRDLPGKSKIAADVIGFFPAEYRITISKGSFEGVRAGLPVITPDGLLGIVQLVGPHSAQVTLIYSPTLKIGAIAQRNPPPAGLIRGESPQKLLLEFVDLDAPAQVGDLVTTTGFSAAIPGGIPIGRIVQIANDKDFGTRRAQVFPNVQIGGVREVFVLR